MQLHELRPKHRPKRKKHIGRGGKRGTYSGKGVKGQKSRSGRRLKPAIRGLIKRYPKLRGYKFSTRGGSALGGKSKIAILNLEILEKKFNSGEIVSPQTLLEKRIIRRIKGRVAKVKILGDGNISKSLTVENCLVSKKAKEKIEKAHGLVK